MARFRKRPVVIEAVQYNDAMRLEDRLPQGVFICPTDEGDVPVCHTLEGDLMVREGDWIITGVKGEHYPCKPDIFRQTYEEIE